MMYMPKHIRIGKAPLISFYFATLRAPQIFVSGLSNRLTPGLRRGRLRFWAVRGFQAHLSKIWLAQNG